MSSFEEAVIQRINQLEREVERLQRWERPIVITDHGALAGLSDDDHTQYLNTTRHDTTTRHTLGTVVPHDDHGSLSGLTDDDHTQYTKHPASSTDNAIVRWDGTGGRTLQNSSVAIDDNGKLSGNGLDGWIYDTDTWTYVSPTSFKITGKDVRYRFPKGTKIKLIQTTTKYFYVVATAFSTDTTVTITGGSDYTLASATISGQAYSYAAAPQGFPDYFSWTPTFTGFSTNPTGQHVFKVIDNICLLFVKETTGTSNAKTFNISAPIMPILSAVFAIRVCDNGAIQVDAGMVSITGNNSDISIYKTLTGSTFTTSGTKYAQFSVQYIF